MSDSWFVAESGPPGRFFWTTRSTGTVPLAHHSPRAVPSDCCVIRPASSFFQKRACFFRKICYDIKVANDKWFPGQAVKTSPSHGENRGSIPLGTAEYEGEMLMTASLFSCFTQLSACCVQYSSCFAQHHVCSTQRFCVLPTALCVLCSAPRVLYSAFLHAAHCTLHTFAQHLACARHCRRGLITQVL